MDPTAIAKWKYSRFADRIESAYLSELSREFKRVRDFHHEMPWLAQKLNFRPQLTFDKFWTEHLSSKRVDTLSALASKCGLSLEAARAQIENFKIPIVSYPFPRFYPDGPPALDYVLEAGLKSIGVGLCGGFALLVFTPSHRRD